MNKIKFILLYYIIISLLSVYQIKADLEFTVYDESSLTKYPSSTNSNVCLFEILLWIKPLNGEVIQSLSGSYYTMPKNSTHYLYTVFISNVPSGQQPFVVSAQDSNLVSFDYTLNINCKNFDNTLELQIGKLFSDPFFGYSLLVNIPGIPSYTQPTVYMDGNSLYPSNVNFGYDRVLIVPYYLFNLNSNITGPTTLSFHIYPDIVKTYTIQNFFSDYYDENLSTTFYPNQIEDQVRLIGKSLYPYYTIQAKTPKKEDPFFNLFLSSITGLQVSFSPISEKNGITTYFGSFYTGYSQTGPFILYVQQHNKRVFEFNQTINIVDVPETKFTSNDLSLTNLLDQDMFLNVGISPSQQEYYLNKIKIGTGPIIRFIEAPYGFTHTGSGGDNSNYNINFTVPTSSYYKYLPFLIGDSQISYYELVDNNNPIPSDIAFSSYEFIYLRNSKYIVKLNIESKECGAGYISFNTIDYKRISQYRVSGDTFNGVYEIPIDFDFDLAFNYITLFDLCGRTSQFDNGQFIKSLPFNLLVVPFLNYNTFSLYSIKDISYLYNNLDVRKNSIGNIMYFNFEGSVNPNTPISFRLPTISSIGANGFFTNEYFATWNSTINKFQVEFVVPKNSRLGSFKFSICNGILNYVSSNYLSDSDQLIISKSNFDPLGPVFSKVDKIPFSDGKFGWSLTISDPINGFDNGTIIVRGSKDNSIYKFDLFPSNRTSGTVYEGVYEIIIQTTPLLCVNQDYVISFVKLWDTGAQFSVFELALPAAYHTPNQLNNPFLSFIGDSTINKYPFTCSQTQELAGPSLSQLVISKDTIDVGLTDRIWSITIQVDDPNVGINIYSAPIIYLTGEAFDILECGSTLLNYTQDTFESAFYTCSLELPVGYAQNLGVFTIGVYGIINNHGIFAGYSGEMLKSLMYPYKVSVIYSLDQPLLLESGIASSRGGEYFIFGRCLQDIETLTITDIATGQSKNYTISSGQKYGLSSVLSIPNLEPTSTAFYASVVSSNGLISNQLYVTPKLFLDYIPDPPLPTNPPQQCLGNPVCGGPTHGTCSNETGCICIYPWKGKSCQDKVIEDIKPPIVNPNEPSTGIDIPDDNDDSSSSNPVNNIKYKSLITLYSLREVDINGNTVKNHKFNNMWTFNQLSDLISTYQINVTTGEDGFNTTVSATLEWFNQSRTITFADQDLEISSNSIKYSIDISSYPFSNTINYLQLVMSATLTSTSSDSCSSKDFGDTTSGDNSNYINIQIDNKSLYGRFIKRGIIDNNRTVSLSNEILDSKLNAISTPSTSQSYIGITIPQFKERATIDPDFSVLLNSNSASSKSNSVCKSKGLSGAKIAGIVIGSVAFAAIIIISITYHFMKKKDAKKFKANITNKLSQMNNTTTSTA